MSIRNIEWIDGRPAEAVRGMVLLFSDRDSIKDLYLVGDDNDITDAELNYVERHAYLVQPHELEWLADMATRCGKGRPEE